MGATCKFFKSEPPKNVTHNVHYRTRLRHAASLFGWLILVVVVVVAACVRRRCSSALQGQGLSEIARGNVLRDAVWFHDRGFMTEKDKHRYPVPTLRGWKATAETELRWPLKLFLRANLSTVGGWNARSRKGFSNCSAMRGVQNDTLGSNIGPRSTPLIG